MKRLFLPLASLVFFAHTLSAQVLPTSLGSSSPIAGPLQPMAEMKVVPPVINPPPQPIFDPRTYGAKADGVTYDTVALQKAIDACGGTGGSVYLSNGKFLSAQLTLRAKMTLYIDKGAVLLGGTNPEDYPVLLPKEPTDNAICRSLLFAADVDHLNLDGPGEIDGQGPLVKMFGKEPFRPSLVRIFYSTDINVRNLTLRNPRMWTQVYLHCQRLTIDNETVFSAKYYENLDGLDLYDCSDSIVKNCHINSDDDSICLKTRDDFGLKNITVENNIIRNTGANGIKIGTASHGPMSGLHILNNTILSAALGGLCIESVDGSAITDVTVHGLDMAHTSQPIFVRLANRSGTAGSINGVLIENVRAVSTSSTRSPSCTIAGIKSNSVGSVILRNCYIEMPGGIEKIPGTPRENDKGYPQSNIFGITPAYAFYVRHATGVVFDHVTTGFAKPDARPWLISDDANPQTLDCTDLKLIPKEGQ